MGEIRNVRYQETLAALATVKVTEPAPFSGMVNWALIHWPAGCNALVDVAFSHKQTRVLPTDGFIALDDTTERFKIEREVRDNDDLTVEIRNADSLNPHTITVVLEVESKESKFKPK